MAAPSTPFLAQNSRLAWEKESSRGSAPSTGSAWRSLGRAPEFQSLGPQVSTFRDILINNGEEAAEVGAEGQVYGPVTFGPYQVRDPLILGHVFGKETARSVTASAGHFQHTIEPTDAGQLPSFSVADRDIKQDGTGDDQSLIFLETIMPRLSLRGEQPTEDGGAGRLLYAADLMAHDHTTTNADQVTVSLGTDTPYRWSHGNLSIEGTQIYRVQTFEFTVDRRARYAFYWRDDEGNKPTEAPPEGSIYDLTLSAVADHNTYTIGGNTRTLREILLNREKFDMTLKFTRTADEDEFQLDLTDVILGRVPAQRGQGKVVMNAQAIVRECDFLYTDTNNSAFFPT